MENQLYIDRKISDSEKFWKTIECFRWTVAIGIGLATGITAFLMKIVVDALSELRWGYA